MSTDFSRLFNETTVSVDAKPINPEELRESFTLRLIIRQLAGLISPGWKR
jgi:hypothetical protein